MENKTDEELAIDMLNALVGNEDSLRELFYCVIGDNEKLLRVTKLAATMVGVEEQEIPTYKMVVTAIPEGRELTMDDVKVKVVDE